MATDCKVLGGDDQVISERYSHWYTIQESLVWQQMLGSADDGMTDLLALTEKLGMKTSKSQVRIVDPPQWLILCMYLCIQLRWDQTLELINTITK